MLLSMTTLKRIIVSFVRRFVGGLWGCCPCANWYRNNHAKSHASHPDRHYIATRSTPTSSLPISPPAPDGLRMAYIVDGNLHFQEGSNPVVQLTDSGEDWRLLFFSENGEKLFFLRRITPHSLYSINRDGSQEKALVTNNILQTIGTEYDEATLLCDINLVPNTHVFSTFSDVFLPGTQ